MFINQLRKCRENRSILCAQLFFIFFFTNTRAQINQIRYEVSVQDTNFTYRFEILTNKISKGVNTNVFYFWYANNQLHNTLGGYDGRLLDGYYQSFYLHSNNLSSKGSFNEGLKTGQWTEWYQNGLIREISNWKNGLRDGITETFDSIGNKVSSKRYVKGEVHGVYCLFDSYGNMSYKIIVNGFEKDTQYVQHKTLWQTISPQNLFKRKKR